MVIKLNRDNNKKNIANDKMKKKGKWVKSQTRLLNYNQKHNAILDKQFFNLKEKSWKEYSKQNELQQSTYLTNRESSMAKILRKLK